MALVDVQPAAGNSHEPVDQPQRKAQSQQRPVGAADGEVGVEKILLAGEDGRFGAGHADPNPVAEAADSKGQALPRSGGGENRIGTATAQALGPLGLKRSHAVNVGRVEVEQDAQRRQPRQQRVGERRKKGREIGAFAGAGPRRLEPGDEVEILGGF